MAGIPTQKIVSAIKRNIIPIFLGYGLLSKYKLYSNSEKAYSFAHSKHDLERKIHLDELEEFINPPPKV